MLESELTCSKHKRYQRTKHFYRNKFTANYLFLKMQYFEGFKVKWDAFKEPCYNQIGLSKPQVSFNNVCSYLMTLSLTQTTHQQLDDE